MSTPVRRFGLAATLTGCVAICSFASIAEEDLTWNSLLVNKVPSIHYGQNGTDNIWIAASCDMRKSSIKFQICTAENGLSPGQNVRIVLEASGGRVDVQGTVIENTNSCDFEASAETSFDDFAKLFSKSGKLQIRVPGVNLPIPLGPKAAAAFARFRANCSALR